MSEELQDGQDLELDSDKTLENDLNWDDKFQEQGIEDEDFMKKVKTLDFQRRHNSEKAKKLATEFEEYKKKYPATEEKPHKKEDKTSKNDDDRYAHLEIKAYHPELGKDDITEALALAKARNISADEAIASPIFKAYLSTKETDTKAQNATPAPSNRSNAKSSSKFDNMSQDEMSEYLKNASEEEMDKYRDWARGFKAPGEIGNGLIIKRSKSY